MKKTITLLTVAAVTVSACAQQPGQVSANYISTAAYDGRGCTALANERNEIVHQVAILTGQQQKKANTDALAVGVGLLLFWPALAGVAVGEDKAPQLANAKGQYEAITRSMVAKRCPGAHAAPPAPTVVKQKAKPVGTAPITAQNPAAWE